MTKIYGDKVVVDNLNFSVEEGEIFGLVGANGAGKSTLMKMICGLCNISCGEVFVCGKSLNNDFENAIINLGGIVEIPQFYLYMTGYQNLKFFAKLYDDIKKDKIMEVAKLVGLNLRINEKVSKYSLGMKQRLGIAQALLHEPKILILDEATNGLDANGIREIKQFLKKIAKEKGTAIMISSHILGIIEDLCDKVCIISKGKIVDIKTINELKKQSGFGTHFIKTNSPNFAGKILREQFGLSIKIQDDKVLFNLNDANLLAEIISTLTSNNVPILGAGETDYSLEDAYLDVVGINNNIS